MCQVKHSNRSQGPQEVTYCSDTPSLGVIYQPAHGELPVHTVMEPSSSGSIVPFCETYVGGSRFTMVPSSSRWTCSRRSPCTSALHRSMTPPTKSRNCWKPCSRTCSWSWKTSISYAVPEHVWCAIWRPHVGGAQLFSHSHRLSAKWLQNKSL
jgi:hypothetical protein